MKHAALEAKKRIRRLDVYLGPRNILTSPPIHLEYISRFQSTNFAFRI